MTHLLKKAFDEASKLSPEEQDALAKRLLEELAMEDRWSKTLERSGELLEELADEALAENAAGDTGTFDPADL